VLLAGAPAGSEVNNAPCGVVDRVNKLVQLLLLVLRQWAWLLVAAREVNIHIGGHFESWSAATGRLVCSCSVLCESECGGADGEDSVGEDVRLWRDC
jgi:hypothetical protein